MGTNNKADIIPNCNFYKCLLMLFCVPVIRDDEEYNLVSKN